jgi:UDP-sulfoquinovose synthase
MRVLVLGGDGYLGWPTALYFSARGHDVLIFDNLSKRHIEMQLGVQPLFQLPPVQARVKAWQGVAGRSMKLVVGDLLNHRYIYQQLEGFRPDTIIHYAEQPSAPFSMLGREQAVLTQTNNVIGTLNLLFAMKRQCPSAHLVKLGTMGEYGTPNIDIEEGFLEITHNGRTDVLPYPKQPGSFYHLSKVHDSHNIMFACRTWGLKATDLNQGVVYGLETDETKVDPSLGTSFHYDEVFGTVLNRFCVQAVAGIPLTVYGEGGQTRGFLNIMDTLRCVELSVLNPPAAGEYRVFNQLTETFAVNDLALKVQEAGKAFGLDVQIEHTPNPRVEKEQHYYNVKHTKLLELGLKPHFLSEELIQSLLEKVIQKKDSILTETVKLQVRWRQI